MDLYDPGVPGAALGGLRPPPRDIHRQGGRQRHQARIIHHP